MISTDLKDSYVLLGFDVGQSRVGLARASSLARLPEPLAILQVDHELFSNIQAAIDTHQPKVVVVGLPKNPDGEETQQSTWTRAWLAQFKDKVNFSGDLELADETLSSVAARQRYPKRQHVDDIAACVILDSYLGNPIDLQTT